jgi:hypothetical protein
MLNNSKNTGAYNRSSNIKTFDTENNNYNNLKSGFSKCKSLIKPSFAQVKENSIKDKTFIISKKIFSLLFKPAAFSCKVEKDFFDNKNLFSGLYNYDTHKNCCTSLSEDSDKKCRPNLIFPSKMCDESSLLPFYLTRQNLLYNFTQEKCRVDGYFDIHEILNCLEFCAISGPFLFNPLETNFCLLSTLPSNFQFFPCNKIIRFLANKKSKTSYFIPRSTSADTASLWDIVRSKDHGIPLESLPVTLPFYSRFLATSSYLPSSFITLVASECLKATTEFTSKEFYLADLETNFFCDVSIDELVSYSFSGKDLKEIKDSQTISLSQTKKFLTNLPQGATEVSSKADSYVNINNLNYSVIKNTACLSVENSGLGVKNKSKPNIDYESSEHILNEGISEPKLAQSFSRDLNSQLSDISLNISLLKKETRASQKRLLDDTSREVSKRNVLKVDLPVLPTLFAREPLEVSKSPVLRYF